MTLSFLHFNGNLNLHLGHFPSIVISATAQDYVFCFISSFHFPKPFYPSPSHHNRFDLCFLQDLLKQLLDDTVTSRVPIGGKSSVCLICMKYRIIITRMRMHAHAHTHTHTPTVVAAVQVIAIRWHPIVTARSAGDNASRWPLK